MKVLKHNINCFFQFSLVKFNIYFHYTSHYLLEFDWVLYFFLYVNLRVKSVMLCSSKDLHFDGDKRRHGLCLIPTLVMLLCPGEKHMTSLFSAQRTLRVGLILPPLCVRFYLVLRHFCTDCNFPDVIFK